MWNAFLYYRAKSLFSLRGKDNKEKRMHIYKFLLDHFTDEQRFSITTKISHSVLGRGHLWANILCLFRKQNHKAVSPMVVIFLSFLALLFPLKWFLLLPCLFQHALWMGSFHWTWKPVSCSQIPLLSLAAKKSSCQQWDQNLMRRFSLMKMKWQWLMLSCRQHKKSSSHRWMALGSGWGEDCPQCWEGFELSVLGRLVKHYSSDVMVPRTYSTCELLFRLCL